MKVKANNFLRFNRVNCTALLIAILFFFCGFLLVKSNEVQNSELERQKNELKRQNSEFTQQNIELKKIKNDINLIKLRFILEQELEPEKNIFNKAINIRNNIYSKVPLQDTPSGFDFNDFAGAYTRSTSDPDVGHICGGLTLLYLSALESLGIPARYVGIFSTNQAPYDSHASLEFFYNGKWYASDPSFNVMFKHKGEYLSYSEVFSLIQRGIEPDSVSNGFPLIKKRKLQNYYIPMKDLFKYMVIHPDRARDPKDESSVYFPSNWDGKILSQDGSSIDVTSWGYPFNYLSSGVLR